MILRYNQIDGVIVTETFSDPKFNLNSKLYEYVKENDIFSCEFLDIYANLPYNSTKEVLLGLGLKKQLTADKYREVYFNLYNYLVSKKEYIFTVSLMDDIEYIKAAIEGFYYAAYKFDKYKTAKKEKKDIIINIKTNINEKEFLYILKETEDIMSEIYFVKDLVNERAEYLYPETLANICNDRLTQNGIKVNIYDERQCKKIGLNAFLSVAKGSIREPRFIVMEYMNNNSSKEIYGLVGKGITYDSGGYSIKTTKGMENMNFDMAGAATVIGAINLIAKRKVKANVVAVVAACENMISGSSYKPGDVCYSLSGKTIEINNTDAEGRVTLADAVYYTNKNLKATKIIDIATLTGACLVALGETYTGALTNNKKFFEDFKNETNNSGEKVWLMPIDEEFKKLNNSKIADIKNSAGRNAGMITAGLFIKEFLCNNTDWIHLDIAGTAFRTTPQKYHKEGATAVHLKTLYNFIKKFS